MKTIYRVTTPFHVYEPQYIRGPFYKNFDNEKDARKLVERVKRVCELKWDNKDSTIRFCHAVYDQFGMSGNGVITGPATITKITEEKI